MAGACSGENAKSTGWLVKYKGAFVSELRLVSAILAEIKVLVVVFVASLALKCGKSSLIGCGVKWISWSSSHDKTTRLRGSDAHSLAVTVVKAKSFKTYRAIEIRVIARRNPTQLRTGSFAILTTSWKFLSIFSTFTWSIHSFFFNFFLSTKIYI